MSATTTCNHCGNEIHHGEHPFCPHGYSAGREPRQFTAIVIHRCRLADGSYKFSYPGQSTDPVPHGYEKLELSTLAQADRFVKDRDTEEMELRRMNIHAEREQWDERTKLRRSAAKEELQRRLGKDHSKIGDMVQRRVDEARTRRYQELLSRQTGFHSEVLSYDKQNRKEFIDDRKKKISVLVNGSRK